MKKFLKFIVTTLLVALLAVPVVLTACEGSKESGPVDYVGNFDLDWTSNTKKQEVTVKLYIDGDTTHFDPVTNSSLTPNYNPSDFENTQGYIKARYIAINTPESTGKIEPYGKKASNFTHDKLASAETIVVESDDDKWHLDSTGGRYLLWVWYKPQGETKFRNLNIEILQEGLAIASKTGENRYGKTAMAALEQATDLKRNVFSDEKDPDFYDGLPIPTTLKGLRCHPDFYNGKKVRVEGIITSEFDNSVYIEDYDGDTGVSFGFAVFYGYTSGQILDILTVGNKVEVVGTVNYFYVTWQISGVSYDEFNPDGINNTKLISRDNELPFTETSAKDIISGKIYLEDDDLESIDYAEAIMSTTVTVSNLTVNSFSTTSNGGDNDGAMSLRCKAEDGTSITVRTTVLYGEDGKLLTGDMFKGKKITVKGVIEKYTPDSNNPDNYYYQIKCYNRDFITIVGE